ncbi:TonB-dependent receptor domain-containing protein [Candidatus Poribacteria bacterium]
MRYFITAYLVLFIAAASHAGVIDGVIYEAGEELEGASIVYVAQTATTDTEGRFVLENVPSGDRLLRIIHPDGRRVKQVPVIVLTDARTPFTFDFSTAALILGEVTVHGAPIIEATPGKQTMQVSEIRRVTGGTNDPLRALQILPGITSPRGFSAGLNVRGGGPDDNSYYFDRVSLSYPYHFGGLATTVNSAAIESLDVHAGGFGAEFGNAQAVIDINASQPERERVALASDLNMIMSEVMLESPVGSNGAFYIAGRRSYADLIIPHLVDIPELTQFPRFWDYQAAFDYDLSPEQKLHFGAFSARDSMEVNVTQDFGLDDDDGEIPDEFLGKSHYIGGFDTQSITLDSSFGDRLMLQSTLSHTRDVLDLEIGSGSYYLLVDPSSYILREDAEYDIHARHKIQAGGSVGAGNFRITSYFPRMPSEEEMAEQQGKEAIGGEEYNGPFGDDQDNIESDISQSFTFTEAYLQDRIAVTDWLHLKPGVRLSYFDLTGDTMVDPRASLSIKIPNGARVRAAWGIYHQTPTPDQFLPDWGNPDVHASKATHYVLELERDVLHNSASVKLAGYYKDLRDLVTDHPTDIYRNQGSGHAQGLEILLKYNPSERFLGWLSYSYSESRRKNNPDAPERLYIFDQTHIATVSMSCRPTPNWELGLRWNYATGLPIAPSDEILAGLREPSTHRLDLRFARTFHFGRHPLQVYLDVLNAYDYSGSFSTATEAQEFVEYEEDFAMPVIPYLGASMKF